MSASNSASDSETNIDPQHTDNTQSDNINITDNSNNTDTSNQTGDSSDNTDHETNSARRIRPRHFRFSHSTPNSPSFSNNSSRTARPGTAIDSNDHNPPYFDAPIMGGGGIPLPDPSFYSSRSGTAHLPPQGSFMTHPETPPAASTSQIPLAPSLAPRPSRSTTKNLCAQNSTPSTFIPQSTILPFSTTNLPFHSSAYTQTSNLADNLLPSLPNFTAPTLVPIAVPAVNDNFSPQVRPDLRVTTNGQEDHEDRSRRAEINYLEALRAETARMNLNQSSPPNRQRSAPSPPSSSSSSSLSHHSSERRRHQDQSDSDSDSEKDLYRHSGGSSHRRSHHRSTHASTRRKEHQSRDRAEEISARKIQSLEDELYRRDKIGNTSHHNVPQILVDRSNVRQDFHFRGWNVRRFLENIENYYLPQGVPPHDLCRLFLLNMDNDIRKKVRTLQGCRNSDWNELKQDMKETFPDERDRHTLKEFDRLTVRIKNTNGGINTLAKLDKYGRRFSLISDALVKSDRLSWQEESRAFLRLFPREIRQELDNRRKMIRILGEGSRLETETRGHHHKKPAYSLLRVDAIKRHARVILEDKESEYDERRAKKGRKDDDSGDDSEKHSDSEQDTESDTESEGERRARRCSNSENKSKNSHKKHGNDHKDGDISAGEDKKRKKQSREDRNLDKLAKQLQSRLAELEQTTNVRTQDPNRPPKKKYAQQITEANPPAQQAISYQPQPLQIQQPHSPTQQYQVLVNPNKQTRQQPPHLSGANATPVHPDRQNLINQNNQNVQETPGPLRCYFCTGEHFLSRCPSLGFYIQQGILTRADGKTLYRGGRLPVHLTQLKLFLEQNHPELTPGATTIPTAAVNSVEYNWTPPTISDSGIGYHETDVFTVNQREHENRGMDYYVEGKRTKDEAGFKDPSAKKNQPDERDRVKNIPDAIAPVQNQRMPFTIIPPTAQRRSNENQPAAGPSNDLAEGHDRVRFTEPTPASEPRLTKEQKGKGRADNDDVEMRDESAKSKSPPAHKLVNAFEQKYNSADIYQALLDTSVNLNVGQIISLSQPIAQHFVKDGQRKRVPVATNVLHSEEYLEQEPLINLSEVSAIPYVGPLGFGQCTVYGQADRGGGYVQALLDSGSQINIISDEFRKAMGLGLRTDGYHSMRGAGGSTVPMMGICERVLLHIGGIEITLHLYCVKRSNFPILLGVPFLHAVGAKMFYNKDGSVELAMGFDGKTASLELSTAGDGEYLYDIPGRADSYVMANKIVEVNEEDDSNDTSDSETKDFYWEI
jgi:hypothetical protein